jgi:carboxyl-terminal processing protease
MKKYVLIFLLILVESFFVDCTTIEAKNKLGKEYRLEPLTIFAESIDLIQKNYIVKPKVKEIAFNAVEGMKEEVTRRGYKVSNLELGWESINDEDIESSYKLFAKAYDSFIENTDIPPNKLVYVSLRKIVENLDPGSSFLTKEERQELLIELKRSSSAVAIEVAFEDDILTVISPIEGTPAYQAGIKAGDKIIKIDDKPTIDLTLTDAVKSLRGPKGSKVKLTIKREGIVTPLEFSITRNVIQLKSAHRQLLTPEIVYIHISNFQNKTTKEVSSALEELESGRELKGLILDLRNNSGGLLSEAIKVSNLFLESGVIVITKARGEGQNMDVYADRNEKVGNYPMSTLVNGASTGAAEIVAAALKENKRALILGATTFGLGSIQTIFPLRDGAGLRLTTAKYYTPSGRSFDGGIQPDVIIKEREGDDAQLIAAKTALQKAADLPPEVAIEKMIKYFESSGLAETE